MHLGPLLSCLLIAIALAASPARAQRTAEREAQLAALQALVDDFEYTAAGPPIDDYLALDDITDDQRARAALLSGVVARTMGDDKKAEKRFILALQLRPELRPNKLYGPKIIEFFDRVRQEQPEGVPVSPLPTPKNPGSETGEPARESMTTPSVEPSADAPPAASAPPEQPAPDDPNDDGVGVLPISTAALGAGLGVGALLVLAVSAGAYGVVATPSLDPQLRSLARVGWLGGLAGGSVLVVAAALAVATTVVLVTWE